MATEGKSLTISSARFETLEAEIDVKGGSGKITYEKRGGKVFMTAIEFEGAVEVDRLIGLIQDGHLPGAHYFLKDKKWGPEL